MARGRIDARKLPIARSGITVNAVCPGFVATDMVEALNDNIKETLIAQIPLGRPVVRVRCTTHSSHNPRLSYPPPMTNNNLVWSSDGGPAREPTSGRPPKPPRGNKRSKPPRRGSPDALPIDPNDGIVRIHRGKSAKGGKPGTRASASLARLQ